jgi:hypothetical protein
LLNDELLSAHQFLYGSRIHPTGELASYPRMPTREEMVGAINWIFDGDANEANATSERIAALEKQVGIQRTQETQGIGRPRRWVQLAQAVGMEEDHPALCHLLEGIEKWGKKITWKESQAAMNTLLGAMEEAWKKKNSH